MGLLSADVVCDLLDGPVDVRGHVRVAHDAEHPPGLVEVRRQLVGPIGDAGPFLRVEELLRRDVHRARVDVRAAADAGAREDENVVEVLDPLDSVELQGGEPDEVRQVPLALRDLLVRPPRAGLHDTDPVALLGGPERGDAPTEPRADDHHVVVETRHIGHFLDRRPLRAITVALARHLAPVETLASSRVRARTHWPAARILRARARRADPCLARIARVSTRDRAGAAGGAARHRSSGHPDAKELTP